MNRALQLTILNFLALALWMFAAVVTGAAAALLWRCLTFGWELFA